MLDFLNNLFISNKNESKYYYGWVKDNNWNKHKLNKYSGEYSLFNTFDYLSTYDNIKYVDLRTTINIPIYNQLDLQSSTSNAISYCYLYDQMKKQNVNIVNPSRLFLFNNLLKMDENNTTFIGASIYSGLKSLYDIGVCSEQSFSYDKNNFNLNLSTNLYLEAQNNKILIYNAIDQDLNQIKSTLINGYPVLFGFNVYTSFNNDNTVETGNVEIPNDNEETIGNQAGVIIGFDDGDKVFIVRNSWGENWGDNGYCYIPYEYILNTNYCSDFWIIKKTLNDTEYDRCSSE